MTVFLQRLTILLELLLHHENDKQTNFFFYFTKLEYLIMSKYHFLVYLKT